MAGAFDCQMVHAELLAHEGPFGVGYGVAYFTPEGRDDSRDIGRQLIEKEANDIAAIREHEDAYGTLAPGRRNLAEEILCNAVSAGMHDPRFPQVTPEELPRLVYDVDVLSEPEPIDSPKALDVKRYGVIVQNGDRRGVLLPDLAGVDTVDEQIAIARRKGNIGAKEKVTLWRFEVKRHV